METTVEEAIETVRAWCQQHDSVLELEWSGGRGWCVEIISRRGTHTGLSLTLQQAMAEAHADAIQAWLSGAPDSPL